MRTNRSAIEGPRPPLRRLLDQWGFVPPLAAASSTVSFRTRDGVRLVADHLPGPVLRPGRAPADTPAVVVAHGFGAHRRKPAYGYLVEELTRVASVLALDLRGHGASHGASTLGDAEVLDVTAAAAWLRQLGHRCVLGLGASMGGSAMLRAAGGAGRRQPSASGPRAGYDAVGVISAPAVWGLEDTAAIRLISWAATRGSGRAAARALLQVRVAHRWGRPHPPDPAAPVDLIGYIHPVPVLVVHGVDDHFFGIGQAEALVAAGGPGTVLWREPGGFGHAEDGLRPAFVARLVDAVARVHTDGRWPDPLGAGDPRAGTA